MRRTQHLVTCLFLMLVAGWATAQTKAARTGPTIPHMKDANPQMLRIVLEDQWERGNDMYGARGMRGNPHPPDWSVVAKHDAQREKQTLELLHSGALTSGKDFYFAALVFQHSMNPDGILLAHVLSVVAVSRGDQDGLWMAAATLDRYLQDLHQPQVFGTQYLGGNPGQPMTMDPYNRTALSDAERALLHVPSLKEQQAKLAEMSKTDKH